ncbi:carbamoyltransferase HypF [Lignipirellula cremea]|uniref:Carbamoyltransferase n=1 Tax=Lignipirellula cremea TaxID=2528010 RepID=A0A518E508_9BACT|nr:carbamoyltransferase HypF [Lignipirellula cremea]QDU99164.1 Carbamoyltransferase HypF [Lignipirellula cremea]
MERLAITVTGVVQGVGFRPFVFRLASRLHLRGFVRNQTGSVQIEVEGDEQSLAAFVQQLQHDPPPLARIDHVQMQRQPASSEPEPGEPFRIVASAADPISPVFISADMGVCDDCLAELRDPADRRYRYPFLNCTNCGPRLTLIESAPYDRSRTTMAPFPLCDACQAEYDDPTDRRFHAQPTACPACGPRLVLWDAHGQTVHDPAAPGEDPLRQFADAVRQGRIGALKGVGGYHLTCDATQPAAVEELRRRKQRDAKPFALMVRDLAAAKRWCEVDADEAALLESLPRPIVLLRKRPDGSGDEGEDALHVADATAPGNPYLGMMLPSTPLHHLLAAELGDRPLVMTSGNLTDEPIACRDDDAVLRLGGLADLILAHNRPIHVRCDDSVVCMVAGAPLPLRRSRGYAPQPIRLPAAAPVPVLAVGGQLKNVFALARDDQAFLSHHLGDLDHWEAYRAFERDIRLYEQLFTIRPQAIVHDLHPDYASTRYAQRRATDEGLPLIGVQHHHAHLASCMAEHGLQGPVMGVILDGAGYGPDGAVWGGEFLLGDDEQFTRYGHLRYVRQPGGDRAAQEPWRMALSHLVDAGVDTSCLNGAPSEQQQVVRQMIDRGFQAPWTSSTGRLFDAVAALLGLRNISQYEGQAAMELEWLAGQADADGAYPFQLQWDEPSADDTAQRSFTIDTRPLVQALAADLKRPQKPAVMARRFHAAVAAWILAGCEEIRRQSQHQTVVLSGGVFSNRLLTTLATTLLTDAGFRVYRHQRVPPGDGGLCLGQLAIAARRLRRDLCNPEATSSLHATASTTTYGDC